MNWRCGIRLRNSEFFVVLDVEVYLIWYMYYVHGIDRVLKVIISNVATTSMFIFS